MRTDIGRQDLLNHECIRRDLSDHRRQAAPHRNNYGRKLGDGVGRKCVGTGTLLLNKLLKETRPPKFSTVPESPSRVVGPVSSDTPKIPTFVAGAETNTPVLIAVIATSPQQMNSVEVDNWFFIANRARVATEEVEIDKDRVVRTVGLDIQGQQGQEGFSVPAIPNISQDLSGDRLVMTKGAVKHQGTTPVC